MPCIAWTIRARRQFDAYAKPDHRPVLAITDQTAFSLTGEPVEER